MRRALQDGLTRAAQRAFTANVGAPVGGLNTRDALAEMPALDATRLDNIFPRQGQVILRGGQTDFATGMTGFVKTIMDWQGPASSKLFAVTDAGAYDITAGGVIGAVSKALTNGFVGYCRFANTIGTEFLWVCNGTDLPTYYDGTTWTNATITGSGSAAGTGADFTFPFIFKHRIFAISAGGNASFNAQMYLYYFPLDSVQGAVQSLNIGALCKKGGALVAGTSWTLDGGDGSDDLMALVTTQGEMLVFKGTDPTSASSWALVGRWDVGKPQTRRCFQKFGGDVVYLSETGLYPLSRLLQSGSINYASALSNKIQPSIVTSIQGAQTRGFDITIYPPWDACIVNIPALGSNPCIQYVMNTVTGAWCTFSAINALCNFVYANQWYFGSGLTTGVVRKAWDFAQSLVSDAGSDIAGSINTSYNYFGSRTMLKHVDVFRPLLTYDNTVETRWGISSDYSGSSYHSVLQRSLSNVNATWDIATWDVDSWAVNDYTYKSWRASAHVPGYALSLWLQIISNTSKVAWSGTDYILTSGGPM